MENYGQRIPIYNQRRESNSYKTNRQTNPNNYESLSRGWQTNKKDYKRIRNKR
jgi:hypothetical protein